MYIRSLLNIIISIGGWMLAVWARLYLPIGKELGSDYVAWPLMVTLLIVSSTLLAYMLSFMAQRFPSLMHVIDPQRQFRVLMLGVSILCVLVIVFLPNVSQLQIAYFAIGTFVIGVMTIVLPDRYRRRAHQQVDVVDNLTELYQKRGLLGLWLRYRIEDRYAETILGIVWIILLPLSQSAVMAFAFSALLGRGSIDGVPWIIFLLSGIAPYNIFRDMTIKAKGSILSQRGIIGRVYYPREIINILVMGETIVDFFFVLLALLIIALVQGVHPNINYLLLPIPIVIMVALSLGISFIVSWLSLVIRDFQQLITVLVQLLFYIVVLYSAKTASGVGNYINLIPMIPVVTAVRDIIIYDEMPNLTSLYYPLVIGMVFLYFGYVYFKANEDRFMDFV